MDASEVRDGIRVRDPATRDQDADAWRRSRFAERVRREWNPVTTATIESAGADMERLADAIHEAVGGERNEILERLLLFHAMETVGREAAADTLIRPGAKA